MDNSNARRSKDLGIETRKPEMQTLAQSKKMEEMSLEELQENLRNGWLPPRSRLNKYIVTKACKGCSKKGLCEGPCGVCEQCKTNPDECPERDSCDECVDCGCDTCMANVMSVRGVQYYFDWEPPPDDAFWDRCKELKKTLLSIIPTPMESWPSLYSRPEKEAFQALLNELRTATNLSGFTRGELESRIRAFACEGCGSRACTCDTCKWCGCPSCLELQEPDFDKVNYIYSDEYRNDYHPIKDYEQRYTFLFNMVMDVLRKSTIPLSVWVALFSKETIMEHFPYEQYPNVWRQYVFDPSNPIKCPRGLYYHLLPEFERSCIINPMVEGPCGCKILLYSFSMNGYRLNRT